VPVLLGAIADDFTGATDLADALVAGGMRTVQIIGVPGGDDVPDADAVVVALKTRSIDAQDAVAQSLTALAYLDRIGARQILFKYCSTFDSTARGNIGPVGDALAQACGQTVTVFCPAYPENGRTIYQGYLFVGSVLLNESGMEHHPLNPMRDATHVRVLYAQSERRVSLLDSKRVRAREIDAFLKGEAQHGPTHVIVDAIEDADLVALTEALADTRLLTGGAGIAIGLPENYRRKGWLQADVDAVAPAVRGGRAAIVAGSASGATRVQVEEIRARVATFDITEAHVAAPERAIADVMQWLDAAPSDAPVMISAVAEPEVLARNQARFGAEEAGRRVESILALAAQYLVGRGVRRLIVAGGETSGAVVSKLGIVRLRIGPRIATGVPWTIAELPSHDPIGLALKSGNFGSPDFFARALEMTA
jgi:uncharacterized protein YgbK (DUF1537 family)